MESVPPTLKTRRVRCWNCSKVVIVPLPIDPSTIMNDIPRYIIPYKTRCPGCGDRLFKFMSFPISDYVH